MHIIYENLKKTFYIFTHGNSKIPMLPVEFQTPCTLFLIYLNVLLMIENIKIFSIVRLLFLYFLLCIFFCGSRQVLPFLLRRMKEDVLDDLPPKITQDYYCELSPLQEQLYEDFAKSQAHQTLQVSVINLMIYVNKFKLNNFFLKQ